MAREILIFHLDLDAFFAAVEQLDHPEWRGKPVIVGARPGGRGVVSTCSYEARVFGVRSALPIGQAYKLCPQGIYVRPRMRRYAELSRLIMKELENFTPEVRQMSVDEAFLNMTGTEGLFGPPEEAAQRIKDRVRQVTGGLTCSIGIAPNHYLAKLASDYRKPDGCFRVAPDGVLAFLDSLPLKKLHGAGKKTQDRLADLRIRTIPELRAHSLEELQRLMGLGTGHFLHTAVRGGESAYYGERAHSHSSSSETTFPEDVTDPEILRTVLLELSHELMFRLLKQDRRSNTLSLKLRLEDFSTSSAQATRSHPFETGEEVYTQARVLLAKKWDGRTPVRLIGLSLDHLESGDTAQIDLFEDGNRRRRNVEKAVLKIRDKGGKITKAELWDLENGKTGFEDG